MLKELEAERRRDRGYMGDEGGADSDDDGGAPRAVLNERLKSEGHWTAVDSVFSNDGNFENKIDGGDAEDIDAHRGASHSQRSVSVWESREVRLRLQAAHCTLRLRVLPRTSSGGHKFKLGALRVAWGLATPKCTDGHTYNHVT